MTVLFASALISASPKAHAQVATPQTTLGGQSACNLLELVPPVAHPLRKHPVLRAAATALAQAGDDTRKNAAALARFEKALAPAWHDAAKVFARPGVDPRTELAYPFRSAPARAFLEKWVFSANAPLRVGEDRFEPALELSAMMALAACRAGQLPDAIAITRGTSGVEGAPLRAFAALLLLEAGRTDEAGELARTLGEDAFIASWVGVELAQDPDEKRRLQAIASRQIQNPDQQMAWQVQAGRLQ